MDWKIIAAGEELRRRSAYKGGQAAVLERRGTESLGRWSGKAEGRNHWVNMKKRRRELKRE